MGHFLDGSDESNGSIFWMGHMNHGSAGQWVTFWHDKISRLHRAQATTSNNGDRHCQLCQISRRRCSKATVHEHAQLELHTIVCI